MSRAKVRRAHRRSMLDQSCLMYVETKTKVGDVVVVGRKLEQRVGYIPLKPWAREYTAEPDAKTWLERKSA